MTKGKQGRVYGTKWVEEIHTGFLWGKVRERGHVEREGVDERVTKKTDLNQLAIRGLD